MRAIQHSGRGDLSVLGCYGLRDDRSCFRSVRRDRADHAGRGRQSHRIQRRNGWRRNGCSAAFGNLSRGEKPCADSAAHERSHESGDYRRSDCEHTGVCLC